VKKQHDALSPEVESLSFTLITSTHPIDLIAPTQEVYEKWTIGLKGLLAKAHRGFLGSGIGTRNREDTLRAFSEKPEEAVSFDDIKKQAMAESNKRQERLLQVTSKQASKPNPANQMRLLTSLFVCRAGVGGAAIGRGEEDAEEYIWAGESPIGRYHPCRRCNRPCSLRVYVFSHAGGAQRKRQFRRQ
jgi:hypothetical protein